MHPSPKRLFRLGKLPTALILLCAVIVLTVVPAWGQSNSGQSNSGQSNAPRRISPSETSAQIYQRYPDLPLENQYTSSETGAAAADNTLVSRLIRYHVYIQRRQTTLRLNWKLTMADYLGAFERIRAERYPDSDLTENPLAGDVAAIEALSVEERDRLVNALYEVFTTTASSASPPAETTAPE